MKRLITGALAGALITTGASALAGGFSFKDPKGDDKGPGKYTYPTDAVYTKGSFDLTEAKFEEDGDSIKVTIEVNAKIEDPWDSKAWGGNGFSIQMIFIFLDTDHKAGSGHTDGLPGLNITFAPDSAWDKALLIGAQGNTRMQSEISSKAASVKSDIVLPTSVKASGKKIVARFPKDKVGTPAVGWGFQVVMQSNEGFPDKTDLLTRKVNEYGGQHRFGGGTDYDCDPHAIDILAGEGKGDASEAKAQYDWLGSFKCDASGKGTKAVIGMVYPKS
ncbi:MAG: glucodextranase DOMON-like domain-containing protein [Myxococcota bacterium]